MDEKEVLEEIERVARKGETSLNLRGKGLTSLPPQIGKLKNLQNLVVCQNRFPSLPAEIENLTQLLMLYIDVDLLPALVQKKACFPNLIHLHLFDQQISSFPEEICELTGLRTLNLSGNQLTSLPAALGKLSSLERLNVFDNQLTSLPAALGKLTNLEELNVSGNPLKSPPPAVVEEGTAAILRYLRELAEEEEARTPETRRYEAKLLILGDGGEGKTCVSKALRGKAFNEREETTQGVDIKRWPFPHPAYPDDKAKRITLNVWDFEGQEIVHQSHQFFLTQRSLYLLVFSGREQPRLERLEYWLDTIRVRAPGCRVVLVATQCEDRTPYIPLDRLKEQYPDLLQDDDCFFAVGCRDGKNIKQLSAHLKALAAGMDLMDTRWPGSYAEAEKVIRERADEDGQNKAHVTRRDLCEIFRGAGIDEESHSMVANLMAALGIITHFPDCVDLEDFVVLKPQWLTKAISRLLEDPKLEEDHGEITHERLHGIWEPDYPGLAGLFHSCMQEFELCYDMEDEEGCLVPLRFEFRPPDRIPWSDIPGAKRRRIEYRFGVTPPAGIMGRFIVKTHHMIVKAKGFEKGVFWHNGVLLACGEGDTRSEALCKFDSDRRVLRFDVRAAFPQNMVERLHAFATAVFSFFEGLEPERDYGCVKGEEKLEEQCQGLHSEKRITYALAKRRKTIDCDDGYHELSPLYLISGISSFGESPALAETLRTAFREERQKRPEWAKEFGTDVRSVLVRVDEIASIAHDLREAQRQMPAAISQRIELAQEDHLRAFNEMLDNRDFNSAPSIVSIAPTDGSKWSPATYFNKKYTLTPHCESEGQIHRCDDAQVPLTMPREWWQKTAPRLALGVKVLSAGIQIACVGLPLGVDPKLFEQMKNEVAFMKELASHLELEGGAVSDVGEEGTAYARDSLGLGLLDMLDDLRQFQEDDPNRMARMQLARLLKEIAPQNYEARQWGSLQRVRMPDSTYRWMCKQHAQEARR